jgi:hypothetical protein
MAKSKRVFIEVNLNEIGARVEKFSLRLKTCTGYLVSK